MNLNLLFQEEMRLDDTSVVGDIRVCFVKELVSENKRLDEASVAGDNRVCTGSNTGTGSG